MPNLPFRPPPSIRLRPRPKAAPPAPRRESRARRLVRRLRQSPPLLISLATHLVALAILTSIVIDRPDSDGLRFVSSVLRIGLYTKEPAPAERPGDSEKPSPPEPPREPEKPSPPAEPEVIPFDGPQPPSEPEQAPSPPPSAGPPSEGSTAAAKGTPVIGLNVPGEGTGPSRDSFGSRQGSGRGVALREFGGSSGSESSVDAGLRWLAAHEDQETGSWTDGDPQLKLAPSLTGLAILAFLGKAHTHAETGPYRDTLARAIGYLLRIQTGDGRFGEPYLVRGERTNRYLMYHQGIATLALAEAYALTHDGRLRDPLSRAVAFIERAQQYGGGWDYGDLRTGRNDTSVTGWQLMALKSAHAAGIEVNWQTLFGAMRHLEASTGPSGEVSYADRGPSAPRRGPGMAAVGLYCRQMLGWPRDADLLTRQADILLGQLPDWEKMASADDVQYLHSTYYWYYGTLAMFNTGGRRWDRWNTRLRDLLIAHQCREGERRGSWEPPKGGFDEVGGRTFVTVLNILSLEVYYRYLPLYSGGSFDAVDVLERAAKVRGGDGMRRTAMRFLAPFRTERAQEILGAALEDPDALTRQAARRALLEQGSEKVIPAIEADLTASSAQARTQAIGDLASLGRKQFVPHIIRGLRDPERVVRVRASSALNKLTGQSFGFLPDAPPDEREKAVAQWEEWWKAEIAPPPPDGVRGSVLVVDPKTPDTVVLDVGRDQTVRPGQRFQVLRDGKAIAILEAAKVEPTLTVARILDRRKDAKDEIREGDAIRSAANPALSTLDEK
jgi:hypothetical protein